MSKQIIIGLVGGGKTSRREMVKEFTKLDPHLFDASVSSFHRTPWGRAEQLDAALGRTESPLVVADIKCLEEAMVIEDAGGFVMHVQGTPSDEVAIAKDSILLSATDCRGRYIHPAHAIAEVRRRCGL